MALAGGGSRKTKKYRKAMRPSGYGPGPTDLDLAKQVRWLISDARDVNLAKKSARFFRGERRGPTVCREFERLVGEGMAAVEDMKSKKLREAGKKALMPQIKRGEAAGCRMRRFDFE